MTQINDYDWTSLKWLVTACKLDWTPISKLTNISVEKLNEIAEACPFTEEQVRAMYVTGSSAWMHMLVLYVLAKTISSTQNIIELGVYVGLSTKFLQAALHSGQPAPTLYSVDLRPFGIDVVLPNLPEALKTPAIRNGLVQRASLLTEEEKKDVTSITGDAIEWLKNYNGPPFDLAFEDTDHTYDTTKSILELLIPHIKSGGIIVSHDVVMDINLKDMPVVPPVNKAWDDVFGDYLKFNGMAFIKI